MIRTRSLLPATLLLLGACSGDGTGPAGGPHGNLDVQLSATVQSSAFGRNAEGRATLACTIGFSAVATGGEKAKADWTGGMIRYYAGPGQQLVDSAGVSAAELRNAFGPRFGPNQAQGAQLSVTVGAPVVLEMELRYRVVGASADAKASARVGCGVPDGAPEGAPPAVAEVNIAAPAGDLEPGDTVRVSWTATGSPAVWETGVEVAGAVQALFPVPGEGRGSVTHTASVVIPRTVQLGRPVQMRVYAVDPWFRQAASSPWASTPVVDRTPPVLHVARTLLGEGGTLLAGQYGDRDPVVLYASAEDNHQLTHVVYEVGGRRDSLAINRPVLGIFDSLPIPLRAGMTGGLDFRVHLRDASGLRSAEAVAQPGAMRVYPVRDATVRAATVPTWARDVLVDPAGGRVYALIANRDSVFVYRLADMTLERTVALPFSGTALELTADGDSLLVSTEYAGVIAVMPANATAAPAARQLAGVAAVRGIRIAHTGRAIALAEMTGGTLSLLEVDLGTGTQRVVAAGVQVPDAGAGVTRSRDRRRMLLGAGCVYDVAAGRVGVCRLMRSGDLLGVVNGDETGARWGRLDVVYGADLHPVLRIDEPVALLGSIVIPHAGGAYVPSQRGLVRVGADGWIAERRAAPALGYLRMSDDGSWMASWDFANTQIRVLDLR